MAHPRSWTRPRFSRSALPLAASAALVAWLVLYPVGYYFFSTFLTDQPGAPGARLTLDNYAVALSTSRTYSVLWTTLLVDLASTTLGLAVGLILAWLVARSDIPHRNLVALIALIPFSLPNLLLAIGWSILGSQRSGALNVLWRALTGSPAGFINIESYGGLVFVVSISLASFCYLSLLGPLSNMDPRLEEAGQMNGAGQGETLFRVTLPLLAPALTGVFLLTFVRFLGVLETPLVLGTPARIYLFSNAIYDQLTATPPQFGYAGVMGMLALVITALLFTAQNAYLGTRSFAVVTGKGYQTKRVALGRFKVPAIIFVIMFFLLSVALPVGQLILTSFLPLVGTFVLSQLTLDNYQRLVANTVFSRALANTLILSVFGGLLCIMLSTLLVTSLRRFRHSWFGRAMELAIWLPWAIPGVLLGVALLWAYIGVPSPIGYGSIGVLLIALLVLGLPFGYRHMQSVVVQLDPELEEAARVHRASWLEAFLRVVLPLTRRGFLAGWFILIFLFSRELASIVLLYSPGQETISIFILSEWTNGRGGVVAATALILMVILIGVVVLQELLLREPGQARTAGEDRRIVVGEGVGATPPA